LLFVGGGGCIEAVIRWGVDGFVLASFALAIFLSSLFEEHKQAELRWKREVIIGVGTN